MPIGGVALVSDDQLITAMVRPPGSPCGGDRHVVSDKMRNSASVREAITLGWILVSEDFEDSSDFVAQVELNALAALVSGISGLIGSGLSGFSGFSGGGSGAGSSGVAGTRSFGLDFHGAADTAEIKVVDDVPYLDFKANQDNRSIWTATVPEDYQTGTDVYVEVYWSPLNTDTGTVHWRLEHKSVAPGANLSGASSISSLTQAASGTSFALQTTGTSLSIPAASIAVGDLLNIAVNRLGKNAADTHTGTARVHHVRVLYTGLVFSS